MGKRQVIVEEFKFESWEQAFKLFPQDFKSVDHLKDSIQKYFDNNKTDEGMLYCDIIGRYDLILDLPRRTRKMLFNKNML